MGDALTLVTGASSDVGLALVRRLAADGARVVAHHRDGAARLAEVAAAFPSDRIVPLAADLREPTEVAALLDAIAAIGDPTHVIHLPALPLRLERFTDVDWDRLDDDLHVQVRALGLILQRLLPRLVKAQLPGRVVVMLSAVVLDPPPRSMASYHVAKGALLGLVRALAADYAERRIAVNAVSPSTIDTRFLADVPSKFGEFAAAANPLKRNVTIAEVVAAIAFLLSPDAGFITGANLPITGGSAFG